MYTPFDEFYETQSETFYAQVSEIEGNSPFINSFDSAPGVSEPAGNVTELYQPEFESELSGDLLEKAVKLNEQYKERYRWKGFLFFILPQIGVAATDIVNVLNDPRKFAIAFAKWQESNGYRGSSKGILDLNNWTFLQKKLGFHALSNRYNINVEKAVAANKVYETKLWKDLRDDIYTRLSGEKILPLALPVNDEYFAYAIADFQKLKGLYTDGILGPDTFGVLKKIPVVVPTPVPVTLTRSKWHSVVTGAVQSPAQPMTDGNEAFKKMVEIIRTANQKDHFIYLLSGWVVDIDFCLMPNKDSNLAGFDNSTTLRNLLTKAAESGVEIKIIAWNNPKTLDDLGKAEQFINDLKSKNANANMIRDNLTYGTQMMKKIMSEVQDKMSTLENPFLRRIETWNEMYAKAMAFPNEGSHHEKVLVVKGSRGLIAFTGGMDINSDRVQGLKGLCCQNYFNPQHNCDLDKDSEGRYSRHSRILHDVHCLLEGEAANTLLKRFIERWNLHIFQFPKFIPPLLYPVSGSTTHITPTTPYVKVLHTFNHYSDPAKKDRSILDTVRLAIDKATSSVFLEDQYMISPEIAGFLNKAVRSKPNLNILIHTQDDVLAGADLMFPHKFRDRFQRILFDGLTSDQKKRISIKILDPAAVAPNRRRVHSKTYIFDDDLAIIGSANCNRRSMTFDSETAVALFQDGDAGQISLVKSLKNKLDQDPFNKWVDYKRNNSLDALDMDVKIRIHPLYNTVVALMAATSSISTVVLLNQALSLIAALLQKVIDPHPDGEPAIIDKELNDLAAEVNYENDLLESEARNYLQINPETEGHFQQSESDSKEREIAEIIEQQVAIASKGSSVPKTCEGHICWAKLVLNKLYGINLSGNNILDESTKSAIANFQADNNLTQTKDIDPATERCLLEADAIYKNKGTVSETATRTIIVTAKTKIEDWTKGGLNGVKNKPQHILKNLRDPGKVWAFVLHHMAFKRRSRTNKQFSDPESYLNTGAHFCIMFDGRIIQLHPVSRMIWHGNCLSPRSVAVEFEGNFPNIKGKWWIDKDSTVQNKDVPTQAQYDAGRFLTSYLKMVLGTTHIFAHRQSSDSRENDPGPDIWYNVGQWAINNLGMTEGGSSFKCGTGFPILAEWRTWSDNTSKMIKKEFDDTEDEVEWEDIETESINFEPVTENFEPEPEEITEEDFTYDDSEKEKGFEELNDLFYETEDVEKDWSKAVRLNRHYSIQLGWDRFQEMINDLLLPFSGKQNVSLGEEAFAQAAAEWQLQQGLISDGIIGPNTWAMMKPMLNVIAQPQPDAGIPDSQAAPSVQNIFDFNQWHAQKILDAINERVVEVNPRLSLKPKEQLENIVQGKQVIKVNPYSKIIQVLPLIYHICEQARLNNYNEIVIGSLIRGPKDDGSCEGHCAGCSIDINHTGRSFATRGSLQMVKNILTYLNTLPGQYKKDLRFGLPLQGDFFGNKNLPKFKRTSSSNLIDPELRQLIPPLGIVFPDNDNHLHIQLKWL
jgi:phosphatidylserine/phosphatidylglycerophosphate/cardiolipin synthase-like enzyme